MAGLRTEGRFFAQRSLPKKSTIVRRSRGLQVGLVLVVVVVPLYRAHQSEEKSNQGLAV